MTQRHRIVPQRHKSPFRPAPESAKIGDREAQQQIRRFYQTLVSAWGPQNWWPAESPFEMIVGAFLTQNTAWTNVEKALHNLRTADALSLNAIRMIALRDLEQLIRPAGYFRQKSERLKLFVQFLDERYGSSLERMYAEPGETLRAGLLGLKGIGPETADSILLYGGNHSVFVVDAYARRIVERHSILPADAHYEEIRWLFEQALTPIAGTDAIPASMHASPLEPLWTPTHPPSALSSALRPRAAQTFNEMHALIVEVGKNYCRKSKPLCDQCPLGQFLESRL